MFAIGADIRDGMVVTQVQTQTRFGGVFDQTFSRPGQKSVEDFLALRHDLLHKTLERDGGRGVERNEKTIAAGTVMLDRPTSARFEPRQLDQSQTLE